MLYLVYNKTTGSDSLIPVTTPQRDENGDYKCKKTSVQIQINKFTNVTFTGLKNMIIPYTRNGPLYEYNALTNYFRDEKDVVSTHKYKYFISNTYSYQLITSTLGVDYAFDKKSLYDAFDKKVVANNITKFINQFIDTSSNNYLDTKVLNAGITQPLKYYYHIKGTWNATLVIKWKSGYNNDIWTTKLSLSNGGKIDTKQSFIGAKFVSFDVDVSLSYTNATLANSNEWEIGTLLEGESFNNYCFYSNERKGKIDVSETGTVFSYPLDYFKADLPIVIKKDENKIHKCKNSHTSTSNNYNVGTNVTVDSNLSYRINGNPNNSNAKTMSSLKFGTSGEYKDGVATVPYVMIELRSPSNPNSKDFYNLSIPAESFVSLTHERNLQDQYNTFKIQLFDKNAMQVESKLLLGFRSITFYYTDFVSTSKRFRGEILNYQTVITGKGLMLTLEGYTSNLNLYTYQDSIPWSIFFEVKDYAFFYWTNKAGEYHGPVRIVDKNVDLSNDTEDYWKTLHYTTKQGVMIPSSVLKANNEAFYNWIINSKNVIESDPKNETKRCDYYLVSKSQEGEEDYNKFTIVYENTPKDKIELYNPYPEEFSLTKYYSNIEDELVKYYDDRRTMFDNRPSNVVIMICIIMGWKTNPDFIVKTKRAVIPDQVSESYLEYIEKKLVPVSESMNGDTQFVFWFDDDGYAHYEPMLGTNKIKKTLYFNSGEKKDSYPLIGFTAATNGAVLMQADASNIISSVNIYTGEEYELSKVDKSESKIYSSQLHQTEEWYTTNTLINKDSKTSLINYQNTSIIPSEDDLYKLLKYRYGLVAKYSYNASLEVYGCADISPGDTIAVYIYIDDGERTDDPVSTKEKVGEIKLSDVPIAYQIANGITNGRIGDPVIMNVTKDKGNLTMHHSSGTYIVQKITDTISGGRYISTLNVLKIDSKLLEDISNISGYETYDKSIYSTVGEDVSKGTVLEEKYTVLDPNSSQTNSLLKWINK